MSQDSLDKYIDSIEMLEYWKVDKNTFDYVYRPNDDTYILFEAIK